MQQVFNKSALRHHSASVSYSESTLTHSTCYSIGTTPVHLCHPTDVAFQHMQLDTVQAHAAAHPILKPQHT
jgi:hypothetical protein